MEVDGVLSGGGAKGIAILGAIHVLEKEGFKFQNIGGTSVGSIIGSLIMSGYTAAELITILETDRRIKKLMRISSSYKTLKGLYKWLSLYWSLGLYSWDELEKILSQLLKDKGVVYFKDMPYHSFRAVASDITRGTMIILPDDIKQYGQNALELEVAKAVRMSCSIPYFFKPVKLQHQTTKSNCLIVDGGILSNFPMWLFEDENTKKRRPTIGIQLTPPLGPNQPIPTDNAIELMGALVSTMQSAYDRQYIKKRFIKDIIFIPVKKIKATSFNLTKEDRQFLLNLGEESAYNFLKSWTY